MPDDAEYTPFIGFVFVDEGSRGKRVSELNEKYGFVKIGNFKTRYGTEDQLFQKTL